MIFDDQSNSNRPMLLILRIGKYCCTWELVNRAEENMFNWDKYCIFSIFWYMNNLVLPWLKPYKDLRKGNKFNKEVDNTDHYPVIMRFA